MAAMTGGAGKPQGTSNLERIACLAQKAEHGLWVLRWRVRRLGFCLRRNMAMDFGWWLRDPDAGKFQVWVVFHGGEVTWRRKQGHHEPWEALEPVTPEMWDRLLDEAAKRVPRRLMSPKQFDELKRVRAAAEDAGTPKPLKRGAHLKRARDLPSPSADA